MDPLHAASLRPFIPSGADYAAARRFFAALGFVEEWEHDGYAGLANGGARFLLQCFDDATFASNLMVRVDVADLDAWWRAIEEKQLARAFPTARFKGPTTFPWGREAHVTDLAGVCWHFGQK